MSIDTIPLHEISENVLVREIEKSTWLNFNGTHRHNFHELLYFTRTSEDAVHSIDFTELPVRTDCIYILKPGQIYNMQLTDQTGYLVAVNAGYLNSLYTDYDHFLSFTLPGTVQMDSSDLKILEQNIRLLKNEISEKNRRELVTSYVKTIITLCFVSFTERFSKSGMDKRVFSLISLIDKYYIEERGIAFYASKLSLSEKRLGVITKETLGVTVKLLLQKRLLLEAKRLISYGNLSLKSIAFRLGFKDASYFSRFFKKYSGTTPEEFKASLK